ncbi:hypothetical protein ACFOET_06950 [Parapedobacter deserti]|uniref:Uncharacterized protein n=1 Tax=Parapedobacter deserti TaxID=1912957 RepID=A0ABV7JH48_9SPHI
MLYLLIILFGGLLSYFGPWWAMAPVCFVLCWWRSEMARQAFWVSALAGVTLWLGYSVYLHAVSGVDLVHRVSGIFTAGVPALANLPGVVPVFSIVALLAALISGFSGLAGLRIKQFIRRPRG